MAKLIFKYTDDILEDCREASEIEFTLKDDLNINEFKVICVRLASALGYHQNSIDKSFGELIYGSIEEEQEIKNLINELTGKHNSKSKY